jgi:hypothetical protein
MQTIFLANNLTQRRKAAKECQERLGSVLRDFAALRELIAAKRDRRTILHMRVAAKMTNSAVVRNRGRGGVCETE